MALLRNASLSGDHNKLGTQRSIIATRHSVLLHSTILRSPPRADEM